jgi:hypothetical protein
MVCRQPGVVEERAGIGIAGVQLIPQRRQTPLFDEPGRQQRLAGTGLRADPDDLCRLGCLEEAEQPFAPDRPGNAGPHQLGRQALPRCSESARHLAAPFIARETMPRVRKDRKVIGKPFGNSIASKPAPWPAGSDVPPSWRS